MTFIKNFYHLILRTFPKLFAFIYAILFSTTYKVLKKKKNKKKRILLLSRERFREDLNLINLSEELEFIYFTKKNMSFLTEPYVKLLRSKMNSTYWFDYKSENFFKNYLESHTNFIFYFLKYFNYFVKFDSLVATSLWYLKDKPFEKASLKLNKKCFFLHKENTVDKNMYTKMLKIWDKQLIKFENNCSIVVYNKNVKKLLSETQKIKNQNIYVLGCPRIDELKNFKDNKDKKNVILASFTYDLGLILFDERGNPQRENHISGDQNIINYFTEVHSKFIEAASLNQNLNFIIKIKYEGIWKDRVLKIIKSVEKKIGQNIRNISIVVNEQNLESLLKETKLLIGVNTLSLVQARICGIPAVMPIFESIKKYEKYFHFHDYFNSQIIIADSSNDLIYKINKLINKNKLFSKDNTKNFINEYFGYSDGKNTERYVNFLLKN